MAKLKAHGNELLRVERVVEETDPESTTTWQRITRTYHSDGKILQKYDVRFKPSTYEPHPGIYSYGWKVYGNLKAGVDPVTHADKVAKGIRDKGADAKWKIITNGKAPVIISYARIERAIKSGESIGFCKECGHSQDGCEPDARNYKCEKCGEHAVYGAEEMLISL